MTPYHLPPQSVGGAAGVSLGVLVDGLGRRDDGAELTCLASNHRTTRDKTKTVAIAMKHELPYCPELSVVIAMKRELPYRYKT